MLRLNRLSSLTLASFLSFFAILEAEIDTSTSMKEKHLQQIAKTGYLNLDHGLETFKIFARVAINENASSIPLENLVNKFLTSLEDEHVVKRFTKVYDMYLNEKEIEDVKNFSESSASWKMANISRELNTSQINETRKLMQELIETYAKEHGEENDLTSDDIGELAPDKRLLNEWINKSKTPV